MPVQNQQSSQQDHLTAYRPVAQKTRVNHTPCRMIEGGQLHGSLSNPVSLSDVIATYAAQSATQGNSIELLYTTAQGSSCSPAYRTAVQ